LTARHPFGGTSNSNIIDPVGSHLPAPILSGRE